MAETYSLEEKNIIERVLCEMFSRKFLEDLAKETGLVKRERKIDQDIMFWWCSLIRLIRHFALTV
jgi:hypothetical protein